MPNIEFESETHLAVARSADVGDPRTGGTALGAVRLTVGGGGVRGIGAELVAGLDPRERKGSPRRVAPWTDDADAPRVSEVHEAASPGGPAVVRPARGDG